MYTAEEVPTVTYTWRISLSEQEQKDVCDGYIREINPTKDIYIREINGIIGQYFQPNDRDRPYESEVWDIKHATKHTQFPSSVFEIFGHRWQIVLYPNSKPNHKNAYVYFELHNRNSFAKDGQWIGVHFELHCTQSFPKHSRIATTKTKAQFDFGNRVSSAGWKAGKLRFSDFKGWDGLKIKLEMQLLTCVVGGKETVSAVSEQTRNYFERKMLLRYNRNDSEIRKVKSWLKREVRLPKYLELFVQNGFGDLESVTMIDEDVLDEIGIDIIGHRLKILKHVRLLNNCDENESRSVLGAKRILDEIERSDEHSEPPLKKIKQ